MIHTLASSTSSKFPSKHSAHRAEECEALVEKLKDYVQGRQILRVLLFVFMKKIKNYIVIRTFTKMHWVF
jgi:hypothetical protein